MARTTKLMSSLPIVADVKVDHEGRSIWPYILEAERAALNMAPTKLGPNYNEPLIGSRVLGFLLQDLWLHDKHSFGLIPYKNLIEHITLALSISGYAVGSKEDCQARIKKLQDMGLYYRNHLFRVFRSNRGSIPSCSDESDPPSRPSLDVVRDRILSDTRTPTTEGSAHANALMRDGYRCMLTGEYDYISLEDHPELEEHAPADHETCFAECAHIFSETAQEGEPKAVYAASALAILEVFGLNSKVENLVGRNVHEYFNILTMRYDLHKLFDRLDIWLEEVIGEENTYEIVAVKDRLFKKMIGHIERVTFRVDPDVVAACRAKNIDPPSLPSPSLLAIRAVCSRVAHISGAADHFDQILRDLEDTPVMAENGGSAHLLASRLMQLSHPVDDTKA
ncbi:uncharacterized protein LACBIDRAFT_313190 [Laccaria bicolor S238N-H82]|uniref:Predicted protein n=1 Tax=Laccaria bicolor (strain S238N-H82 / ATCC MYA-4686) TaxID=486041 RepID=B0DXR6_LACBS|nr:uncharacterized protein LACBIDRAFT_313190 [Laccaria bicolor S238N-H82]EDR00730.1 predicted protein [Laccaria bicolor S238N-H82]|eukprot:XP_001888739.1 predicted protein [Laccaria bicolor S238N-H82]